MPENRRRMSNKLQEYFPMIKTREEILKEINGRDNLKRIYDEWDEQEKNNFLDMCTGAKGVKLLYDSFFKEIMSPEYTPERIGNLLSVLMDRDVKVIETLPNESRIADETSLLILDILVKLGDGSLANIEVQKIGYKFAGERAACYSADLLMRQYKRVREASTRKTFNYKNIKEVYTIVFFENSPKEFLDFYKKVNKEIYIHKGVQQLDSGVRINLLQKYIFISLDIFNLIYENKSIDTKKAAWLTFLSVDAPERIVELIQKYPEYKLLYGDLYNMCRNVEKVMNMYSKELREMDRNTVILMIDEYQEELDNLKKKMEESMTKLAKMDEDLARKDEDLARKDEDLARKDEDLAKKDEDLARKDEELAGKEREIAMLKEQLKNIH